MNSKKYLMLAVCSSLVLSACGSGGGSGKDDAADEDTTVEVPEQENALATFGNLAADDDPLALTVELESDIETVFGGADNASTDVVVGDTVQTVIDRATLN